MSYKTIPLEYKIAVGFGMLDTVRGFAVKSLWRFCVHKNRNGHWFGTDYDTGFLIGNLCFTKTTCISESIRLLTKNNLASAQKEAFARLRKAGVIA